MNNFASIFEELNKLYEEEAATEAEKEEADKVEEPGKEELTEAAEDEVAAEDEAVEDEVPSDEALVEEPAVEDEPRQVICECDKCGALVIIDEADVVVDEETDLVNVEAECQFCEEAKGYKIVGVVAPYEVAEEAVEDVIEEPAEEEFVEEAVEAKDEEELEEIFDLKPSVSLSLDGGQGNDVSVLGH